MLKWNKVKFCDKEVLVKWNKVTEFYNGTLLNFGRHFDQQST